MLVEIDRINIRKIANGWIVDIEFDADTDDEWLHEKFYFATIEEVVNFIISNKD